MRPHAAVIALAALAALTPQAASSWHTEMPLEVTVTQAGPGWTKAIVAAALGNVSIGSSVDGGMPFVTRVDVRDADGTLTLSFEAFADAGPDGVEVRTPVASPVVPVWWVAGISILAYETPDCESGSESAWIGPLSTGVAFTFDAACLGPQPWSILSYAAGDRIDERNLELGSDDQLVAVEDVSGEGATFVRMTGSSDAVELGAHVSYAGGASAVVAQTSLSTDAPFVGSFAVMGGRGILARVEGASEQECPCRFDGLPAGDWTFQVAGADREAEAIYLAGVQVPG